MKTFGEANCSTVHAQPNGFQIREYNNILRKYYSRSHRKYLISILASSINLRSTKLRIFFNLLANENARSTKKIIFPELM